MRKNNFLLLALMTSLNERKFPDRPFDKKLHNPSHDVTELHKIGRSPNLEGLKL